MRRRWRYRWSKEPDASWVFARYMTALRGAEINCAGPGFPCVKTIDVTKISQAKDKEGLKTIMDGIPFSKDYVLPAQVADQVSAVISREMGLLKSGAKLARDVAGTIASDTSALLPK